MEKKEILPEIGLGCTLHVGSDSYPATIVKIKSVKSIVIQRDNFKRTDKNGIDERQSYEYSPNPDAAMEIFTKRKNGRWVRKGDTKNGQGLAIGYRRAYQDPCF